MKILALLFISSVAAAAEYTLPDPVVQVNLQSNNTVVTVGGITYHSISDFVYVGECVKPDGPYYHCNVMKETDIMLFNGQEVAVATITGQFSATLIRSGHNYWRNSSVLLNGELKTP